MNHTTANEHGSFLSYTVGFILSIVLTVIAYLVIVGHVFQAPLIGQLIITALAIAQFLVQLIFFLHIGFDTKSRWKLAVFLFMLLMVGILVVGSLWIMHNLDYNMLNMNPKQILQYMNDNQGL